MVAIHEVGVQFDVRGDGVLHRCVAAGRWGGACDASEMGAGGERYEGYGARCEGLWTSDHLNEAWVCSSHGFGGGGGGDLSHCELE